MQTRLPFRMLLVPLWMLLLVPGPVWAEGGKGEPIYRQRCASCHGAAGEGTKEQPKPLAGDKTVAQLARLIAKTMPEDDPGTCTGADAEAVAAYIHEAFYSPAAQARHAPPRVELSRLTVRQYRGAVADLIGGWRSPGNWDDRRGLHGEYFKSRRFGNRDRVIDRLDPEVRFDFGTDSPEPKKFDVHKFSLSATSVRLLGFDFTRAYLALDKSANDASKMDPREFSIRWEGSVLAPETGEYDFIVRTEHATRLWVNDNNKPLIDAWVKSGNDNEYRASIFLLGGRVYPLKLEFSKAKQGVDDSQKNKNRPVLKASIALAWKLPHRTDEIIPARLLSPNRFPETFVVTTPFPPDDRSAGYERGTSVSEAWERATTDAAIEVAGYVASHLREFAGVGDNAPDREKKLREFCLKFAERAFRRPLSDEQKTLYVERRFRGAPDPGTAVKRSLLFVLKSPRFLYREAGGDQPDAYDVASRLSFGLWDSLPDAPLLAAAASGKLANREQITAQAERMTGDLRTRAKIREFFLQWLRVEHVPELSKDPAKFPGFDPALASDLRTSLDLFLEDVVWGETSDFRRLFLDDQTYLNGRLAKYYGADLPPDAPFRKVALEPKERAGVLSHPYLLATFAYTGASSPIHRGVFLSRSVLGRSLRPPPIAVAPLAPDLHAGLTTRERVTLQTRAESCQACHGMINHLGFPLEHFDAVGRYRNQENGKPIDATGIYQTRSGETVTFGGTRELAAFLARSEETHAAFVEQLFHYLVKQPARAFGPRVLPDLGQAFARDEFKVRKLIVEIMAASALPARKVKP